MKRIPSAMLASLILLLAACEPKPAAPPAQDEAGYWHEQYFGDAARDPAIAWRSSGLGIRVLAPGEGRAPGMTDRIRVHYTGKLKDGTVFADSHAGAGKPADFVVNQLIPGWAAAMSSLKPGGRAIFYVPPQLGYGAMARGKIPPHAGLIFEVELIAVNPEK